MRTIYTGMCRGFSILATHVNATITIDLIFRCFACLYIFRVDYEEITEIENFLPIFFFHIFCVKNKFTFRRSYHKYNVYSTLYKSSNFLV